MKKQEPNFGKVNNDSGKPLSYDKKKAADKIIDDFAKNAFGGNPTAKKK
ncbi:MAG: hypothetical protein V4456_12515 [Bacteroidota bacterium]